MSSRPDPAPSRRYTRWLSRPAIAAIVALVAAAHSGMWWVATTRIMDGIPSFVADAAGAGWRIEGGTPLRTGWPWMATIRIPSVAATRVLGDAAVRWTAERVDVSLAPMRPRMIEVAAGGPQTIALSGSATLPFQAGRMLARVPLSGGPIDLLADALTAGTAAAGLRIAFLTGSLDGQSLAVDASGVVLSPTLAAPFDGPVAVSATIATNAPFPAAPSPGQSAASWRDSGGRMELTALALHWGKLSLEGSGTGGLDAQLQPEGRAVLRVQGATEALDTMAQAGLVAPGPASAARAVLGLLVLAAHGGPVTLPIAVTGRVLTVTQFPVFKLPSLDWNLP